MAWDDGEERIKRWGGRESTGGSEEGPGQGQTLLAAECSIARMLLQVKMNQSCLKSG